MMINANTFLFSSIRADTKVSARKDTGEKRTITKKPPGNKLTRPMTKPHLVNARWDLG